MTIAHHPSDLTIAAFLDGKLDAGRRLLVAAHVERCRSCANLCAALDQIGGEYLESVRPTALELEARARSLGRLDAIGRAPQPKRPPSPMNIDGLPSTLSGQAFGPWRWIGPGVYQKSALPAAASGARVFLLKAAPGTSLPHHTHTGSELTLILKGAFAHQGGRFGVGDFDEADGSVEHQPIVEPDEECICLVAMEGKLRLLGLVGRLLQPFVRM